jgi:hypothetical protein
VTAILAFPTLIWTALMGVVLVYWLFVIIGALDTDLLNPGAHDGAGEAIGHGAAEGLGHGAAEGLGHGATEGLGDGAADALGHGADHAIAEAAGAHGHADVDAGGAHDGGDVDGHGSHDTDLDGGAHGLAHVLMGGGLKAAPVTVTVSLLVAWSWLLCFFGMYALVPAVGAVVPHWLIGIGVLAGSFLGSVPLTSLCLRPMAGLFTADSARGRETLVGKICVISTGRVDAGFGQATYDDGGAGLIVQVRCDKKNELKRGDQALIIDYDQAHEAFSIEPLEKGSLLAENLEGRRERGLAEKN